MKKVTIFSIALAILVSVFSFTSESTNDFKTDYENYLNNLVNLSDVLAQPGVDSTAEFNRVMAIGDDIRLRYDVESELARRPWGNNYTIDGMIHCAKLVDAEYLLGTPRNSILQMLTNCLWNVFHNPGRE